MLTLERMAPEDRQRSGRRRKDGVGALLDLLQGRQAALTPTNMPRIFRSM